MAELEVENASIRAERDHLARRIVEEINAALAVVSDNTLLKAQRGAFARGVFRLLGAIDIDNVDPIPQLMPYLAERMEHLRGVAAEVRAELSDASLIPSGNSTVSDTPSAQPMPSRRA